MDRETRESIKADLCAQLKYAALAGGTVLCCFFGALTGALWAGAAAAAFGGASMAGAVAMTAVGAGWVLVGMNMAMRAAKALSGTASKGLIAFTLAASTLGSGAASYHISAGSELDRRAAHDLRKNNLHLPLNKEMRDAVAAGAVTRDGLEMEAGRHALEFARRSVRQQNQERIAQYEHCLRNPGEHRKLGLSCVPPGGPAR
ncbi:MAG: hypothetical protein HY370_05665 [Proteobacteria bacterium]|nr:hypothetical protein [Pseudomonadota bacterium]